MDRVGGIGPEYRQEVFWDQIAGLRLPGAGQQENRQLAGPRPLWAKACLRNLQLQCYFLGGLCPASDPQCWLVSSLVISLQDQDLCWDSELV